MDEEDEPLAAFIAAQARQGRQRRHQDRPLTIKELETMLEEKSPTEIMLRISREDGVFNRLLEEGESNLRKVYLSIRVMAKALVNSHGQQQAVLNLMLMFKNAIPFQDRVTQAVDRQWGHNIEFITDLVKVINIAMEKYPNDGARCFAHLYMKLEPMVLQRFSADNELCRAIDLLRERIMQPRRLIQQEEEEQRRVEMMQRDGNVDPNLFRELSIVPTAGDFDPAEDIHVRANKVHGYYDNVNDYLDIQFRLLRADLILPLRSNILKFLGGEGRRDLIGIRAYSDVRIVRPVCHDKGLCFRLSFDISKLRGVNWSVTQRLKYGSLLCLSTDNFQTYMCAVVENRDAKELRRGLVDVQFILNANGPNIQVGGHEEFLRLIGEARDHRYIMVESPTYFEAYKYVLQGLQNITENNFPFWRYIGECNPQVEPPQYITNNRDVRYDLRPLVDSDFVMQDNPDQDAQFSHEAEVASAVDVLNPEAWPTANTFSLDNSQFVALQSALIKEFSIIQGPPGTGKTFIGLMVMKALLHNKRVWNEDNESSPILLVCYTNHALDQFLEGILNFFSGKLVRVGSRSKSERLEQFNLRGMRNRARENRMVNLDVHLAKQETRINMKDMKADIHKEAAKLEILEREIVKETFLKTFIHETHFKTLTQRTHGDQSVMPEWLMINSDLRKLKEREVRKRRGKPPQQGAVAVHSGAAAHGGDENVEGGDEDEDDDDEDLVDLVNVVPAQGRHLDMDEDEEQNDEYFAELFENLGEEFVENVKSVNRKLDLVDTEAAAIRRDHIAFNISECGEERKPQGMTEEEAQLWKKLTPIKQGYRGKLLSYLQKTERMEEEEVGQVYNVWLLKRIDRWRLYRYWVNLYCRQIRGAIRDNSQKFEQLARRYQEILHQEDKSILEKATIIGMTTTGAARYQGILREIAPKIVLVEEAAEVLEGHVLTSLTDQCQHVVLIGDHKQLRPNPSVYELKKNYGLDISLFERLINNGFRYDCLKYQHRMRPEISRLLRIPDLYPDLEDDPLVKNYPDVTRVKGNVCFIQQYEYEEQENDTRTFSNPHEAKFLIGLCEYLLHQGYKSSQITILSPYAGQINFIKNNLESLAKSHATVAKLKGLKISSVDNYQGEENDIILLSLVRSNADDDIGFLKANNRICVALSRAKIGLYAIGNFVHLSKSSPLIREISNLANRLGYLNDHLVLTCLHHKRRETTIKKPKDFERVPEGGCTLPCEIRLDCGHSCKRACHTDDMEHKAVACNEKCQHLCEKCGQHCQANHKCGNHDRCSNLVEKRIPTCQHRQIVPCHMEPNLFECQERCLQPLPCGHQCTGACGVRHEHSQRMCKVKVEVESKVCGHKQFKMECGKQADGAEPDTKCPEPCRLLLDCGHICRGTCGACRNGRLHLNCQEKCQKVLICGHSCQDCCSSCPPCTRPCETACTHSLCPRKCGELCTPCLEPCSWSCNHQQCADLCCQPCERPPCDIACPRQLPCGHNCCGVCGEKCPRLCTICDKEELMSQSLYGYDGDPTTLFLELDCGHVQEVDFMDQWMVTETATADGSDQKAIGLKACPVCKSPIRKVDRYNKQIKQMLLEIERVKRKYIGDGREDLKRRLERIVGQLTGRERQVIGEFLGKGDKVLSEMILAAQINQIMFYRQISSMRRIVEECRGSWGDRTESFERVLKDLDCFSNWVLEHRAIFSEQNQVDAQLERDRLRHLIDLQKIDMRVGRSDLRDSIPHRLMFLLRQCVKNLSEYKRADKKMIEESIELCEKLKELVPESYIALTLEEKQMIVNAVNVSKGAWYKCPNGHIYAIGECGQAMEESKCPECKEVIGGTNHNLVSTNQWAREMDDAEQPVWNNLDADRALAEALQLELGGNDFLV